MTAAPTQQPSWFAPDAPSLTTEETRAATKELVSTFPQVARDNTLKPYPGQEWSFASMNLFKEPRKLSSGKNVYGFLRLGTCHPTQLAAEKRCAEIIQNEDSKHSFRIAPPGRWVPITDDTQFCKDSLDVNTEKTGVHLRDDVAREKAAEHQRIGRELREREEQVRSGDIYDDPTSLMYYTMKRNTEMVLKDNIIKAQKKMEEWKALAEKTRLELANIQKDRPEYADQWLDCFNAERSKVGLPTFIPAEDQFAEYDEFFRSFLQTA